MTFCLLFNLARAADETHVFVDVVDGKLHFSDAENANTVLEGRFLNSISSKGFGQFDGAVVKKGIEERAQMYALGAAEGYLTHVQIGEYRDNVYSGLRLEGVGAYPPAEMQTYVKDQIAYIKQQTANLEKIADDQEREFWRMMDMTMAWLEGLVAGYVKASGLKMTLEDAYYLNSAEEYLTLAERFYPELTVHKRPQTTGPQCEGVVYVDFTRFDCYVGQVAQKSWAGAFNRITKAFSLKLNLSATSEQKLSFSGYPGQFASLEEFYLLRNNLNEGQTTALTFTVTQLKNLNNTAVLAIPESAPAWMRTIAASIQASTASSWVAFFQRHSSGTTTAAFSFLDYAAFKQLKKQATDASDLKERLAKTAGVLTAFEVAGQILGERDATAELAQTGFVGSFSVPLTDSAMHQLGYTTNPREDIAASAHQCLLVRYLGNGTVNMEGFKSALRSNSFLSEPQGCTKGDPRNGLSPRYDLCNFDGQSFCKDADGVVVQNEAYGAIDTKVTSVQEALYSSFEFIHGPTVNDGTLPKANLDILKVQHAGVQALLPLSDKNEFSLVQIAICRLRDENCFACSRGMKDHKEGCAPISQAGSLCGILLPCGVMFACVLLWVSMLFMRRSTTGQTGYLNL